MSLCCFISSSETQDKTMVFRGLWFFWNELYCHFMRGWLWLLFVKNSRKNNYNNLIHRSAVQIAKMSSCWHFIFPSKGCVCFVLCSSLKLWGEGDIQKQENWKPFLSLLSSLAQAWWHIKILLCRDADKCLTRPGVDDCSAKTREGISYLLDETVRVALASAAGPRQR